MDRHGEPCIFTSLLLRPSSGKVGARWPTKLAFVHHRELEEQRYSDGPEYGQRVSDGSFAVSCSMLRVIGPSRCFSLAPGFASAMICGVSR
jgi:hypothetical protein